MPIVWLYWAVSLTIVTLLSGYIVRYHKEYGFAALLAFYTIYLAASQLTATRIVVFDLGFHKFFAPAAVFLYPFIAQAIDMINEVYGRKKAHFAIGIAFATQVLLVIFILLIKKLSPAPFFFHEEAWQEIFSLGIRITIASWVSFLICQNVDAYIFSFLKKKFESRVLLRSISSDIVDLTLDSFIFITLAFYGRMPIIPLLIGQLISKNLIGIIDTPWFLWYKKIITKK